MILYLSKIYPWIVWKVNMSVFCVLGWFKDECESVAGDFTRGTWPFAYKGALLFDWLMGISANAGELGCVCRSKFITCWVLRCSIENVGFEKNCFIGLRVSTLCPGFQWISTEKSSFHKWLSAKKELKNQTLTSYHSINICLMVEKLKCDNETIK